MTGWRADSRTLGAALGLVAAAALAACTDPGERRGPQPIRSWTTNGGEVLTFQVDTCNGDPKADIAETETTVTVTIVSTKRVPGDACLDSLDVTLEVPLGTRTVVDGTTGMAPEPVDG